MEQEKEYMKKRERMNNRRKLRKRENRNRKKEKKKYTKCNKGGGEGRVREGADEEGS